MPTSAQPAGTVTRRLEAFGRSLRPALGGDVDAVHKARVASRRLREAVPVVTADAQASAARRINKALRRVTRALGPVREIDVCRLVLARWQKTRPELAPALAAVDRHLASVREKRREAMLEDLTPERVDRIVERAGRLQALAEEAAGRTGWRRELARRIGRRAARLRDAIERAGALYAPDLLHEVRIATKQLRYAVELASESGAAPAPALVRELKAMQDMLGSLHDLQVLLVEIGEMTLPPGGIAGLDALVARVESECRARHAEYLTRRGSLIQAADTARDRIVPRIEAGLARAAEDART